MALDVQQVEQLNRKAQQLNSDRQQKIGMHQAAQQSYDRAVLAYEQKYGVKLDDTNLQSEYNGVHTQLEQSYKELNDTVIKIENGDFTQHAEPSVSQNNQAVQVGAQTQYAQQTPTITPDAVQQAMQQATSVPIAGATAIPNIGFGAQQTPQQTFTAPPVLPQNNVGGIEQAPADKPFTPTSWGTAPDINQQFSGINNGKPFGQ